jgi:uncharacterized protein
MIERMPENEIVIVTHNEKESQFETKIGDAIALAAYDLQPGLITFTHTNVPQELSGRGIAAQLAKFGLEHARSQKLKVVASCSFIAKYIERNPEYHDLID